MTEQSDLDHQRVADGLLAGIASGEYEVGARIPSTTQLGQLYGVSATTVRRAVARLQGQGILEGHPGKGVYVVAMPDAAAMGHRDLKALGEQVAELAQRADSVGGLLEIVSRIESNLIELYGKTGFDYPEDGAPSKKQRQHRAERHG